MPCCLHQLRMCQLHSECNPPALAGPCMYHGHKLHKLSCPQRFGWCPRDKAHKCVSHCFHLQAVTHALQDKTHIDAWRLDLKLVPNLRRTPGWDNYVNFGVASIRFISNPNLKGESKVGTSIRLDRHMAPMYIYIYIYIYNGYNGYMDLSLSLSIYMDIGACLSWI